LPSEDLLNKEQAAAIAGAIRAKLLSHPDVRIRWAAVQTLGENRWLTVEDVKRGLDDKTDAIRVTTAFWLVVLREPNDAILYDRQGGLVEGTPGDVERMIAMHGELAPVLLDHVNDTHFFVRFQAAAGFRALFQRWEQTERGRRQIDLKDLPPKIDWERADWQTRRDTQAVWQQWWAEHGEAALVRSHLAGSAATAAALPMTRP
jgi:hypothetical protein